MLNTLKKCLKNEKNDKTIFDIVLYGSSVKGSSQPHDIDILIVFTSGMLKERLEKIQTIKKKIKINTPLDVKGVLFSELFDDSFFARSGVFLEGISIFDGLPFSRKIGFDSAVLFFYRLNNKSHTEKVTFNYLLRGRNDMGILTRFGAKSLAPGVVRVPLHHFLEFEEILKRHTVTYSVMNVLVQI